MSATTETKHEWHERIKIAWKFTGKSQNFYGDKLGLSQNMISLICKGDIKDKNASSVVGFKKLLVEEGISKAWLDKEEGEMSMKVIQEDYRKKYEKSESESSYLKDKVEDLENRMNKVFAILFRYADRLPAEAMTELGKLQASSNPKNANLFFEKKNNQRAA